MTRGEIRRDPSRLPVHPGEILREEFMVPLGLTAQAIAEACGVPTVSIERIADESAGITTDTAHRLGRYFSTTPALWMNLQRQFEIDTLMREAGPEIAAIKPYPRDGRWGRRPSE